MAGSCGLQRAPGCTLLIRPAGKVVHSIDVAAHAGTAFDGRYLYQIAEDRIEKVDPKDGHVLSTIPAPGGGTDFGPYLGGGHVVGRAVSRPQDPSGRSRDGRVLRTIEANRFVTGVSWVDGELWHGTLDDDGSDVRRVDPETGVVLEKLDMPPDAAVSGLESDGGERFFCGGASSGRIRAVRRPRRGSAAGSGSDIPVDASGT